MQDFAWPEKVILITIMLETNVNNIKKNLEEDVWQNINISSFLQILLFILLKGEFTNFDNVILNEAPR